MRKYHGECLQVKTLYAVHAKDHERGQENISLTAKVDSIYGLLDIVVMLKATGYRKVDTVQCGIRYYHPATGEEVRR